VGKIHEGANDILTLLDSGRIQYVVSTSSGGRLPTNDDVRVRRKAVERSIACLTSIDTANALIDALKSGYNTGNTELVDITKLKTKKERLRFWKMRASGNDYIYFDCFDQSIESPESLAVALSRRQYSIGGDGIVMILPSGKADARMRMFNKDGSEGEVAGNAMKCVAKYLYESGRAKRLNLSLETGGGIKTLQLYERDGEVFSVKVDMGKPDFAPAAVPVEAAGSEVVDEEFVFDGGKYRITCLSMGNPHCVIFVDDVDAVPLEKIGPLIEHAAIFPRRANVSFAQLRDPYTIKMRVWERGIGETMACGTGACAVVAAAVKQEKSPYKQDISVKLRGGDMVLRWDDDGISMMGDAVKDFEGIVEV
jgi:carbamoyl-phosphate synthase large subunit